MEWNFFQTGPYPTNAMSGHYDYALVLLSYVIAVLASYVALDLAGRLQAETENRIKAYWLLGGAFAMGAGIWSMHFIGMLAFKMDMPMSYDIYWTTGSVIVAVLASGMALYLLRKKHQPLGYVIVGGVIIGLGIAAMHYMGMTAMTAHVKIRYLPSYFFLSIVIAIVAAEAALWLAFRSNIAPKNKQFYIKAISALVMGVAICGMHYTGMVAAVFTPLAEMPEMHPTIDPTLLAFLIAMVTILIISIALMASIYHRHMQTGIQNEKDFLNIMLNNLNDEIIACNIKGIITVCNNTYGKYSNNLLSKPYSHLDQYIQLTHLNATKVEMASNPLLLALQGDYIKDASYLLNVAEEEKTREVIVNAQPILNSDGERMGAVMVIHDVTALKHTEKLKKEFVSIVSHELRTPLTSIKGSLSLLLGGTKGTLPESMAKLLQIASNNTERLIRLINDILDIEKIEAGKMEFKFADVDLKEVIESALTDVQSLVDKAQIKIAFEGKKDIFVNADRDRLIQVIINLLSNAIRYSSPGQVITVKMVDYTDTVKVTVHDQGPGIPVEFQNRIFQKFSQADSSSSRMKGGTGLGLSICKAIIEKHGGTIGFESDPKNGTCFFFELAKEEHFDNKVNINPIPSVLICDSNIHSAELIKNFLLSQNVQADIALTVTEARKYLTAKQYELITVDIVLQDYDGIKFIRELREDPKTQKLPIMIMTTNLSEDKELINGLGFPIIDWIQKPFEQESLYNLLTYVKHKYPDSLPKVLSVEDDSDICSILKAILKNEASLECAGTLIEARKMLAKNSYDLIILDLKLPDGLGTDLLPCINPKTHEVIPVVVFSAYELDPKYAHLVRKALLKTTVSNERLFSILSSILKKTKLTAKA